MKYGTRVEHKGTPGVVGKVTRRSTSGWVFVRWPDGLESEELESCLKIVA